MTKKQLNPCRSKGTTKAVLPVAPRTELVRIREQAGKIPAQLAREIGITRQFVYKVESGQRHPSYAIMERWLNALPHASADVFFHRAA